MEQATSMTLFETTCTETKLVPGSPMCGTPTPNTSPIRLSPVSSSNNSLSPDNSPTSMSPVEFTNPCCEISPRIVGATLKRDTLVMVQPPDIIVTNVDEDHEVASYLKGAIMASPRPKSPRPLTPKKEDKDESFWDKLGTLGRKKRVKEVQEVQQEGKYAIDSPGSPLAPDLPPEDYDLEENEERSMIEPKSFEHPKLQELILVLIQWMNDELASHRIIVQHIDEDLYDGQILQKLLEKLSGRKLDSPEVTQSEEGQKQKLKVVIDCANKILGLGNWSQQKWSVESIHTKNIVSILHLLVALVRHFRAPVRLPENVNVTVVIVQKRDGLLSHHAIVEEMTSTYEDVGMRCERDAFDTLFDHAPDKLQVVKKSLISFVNKHLNKINLEVYDLDTQFNDGVYLTLLMGLLEGYFTPLYDFHLMPREFEQKVQNVAFAFELMQDAGLPKPKARPEDIVNTDLKSTLRVLYNIFTKYKNIN